MNIYFYIYYIQRHSMSLFLILTLKYYYNDYIFTYDETQTSSGQAVC